MNQSMMNPVSSTPQAQNMTPDNIIGALSNIQEVQTDLNVDLLRRNDSLNDTRKMK